MKLFAKVAFAAAFIGSASFAGSIAPSDVAFGSDGEVTASLTGVAGDAGNGRKLFMNRKKGKSKQGIVESPLLPAINIKTVSYTHLTLPTTPYV